MKTAELFPQATTDMERLFESLWKKANSEKIYLQRILEFRTNNSARLTAETIKRTALQREVISLKETAEAWKWWGRFHRKSATVAWIVALVSWVLWAVGK